MEDTAHRSSIAPRPSWTVLPDLPEPPATVLDYLIAKFPRIPAEAWADRMARSLVIDNDRRPPPVDAPYRPFARVGYFRELTDEVTNPLVEEILFRSEHLLVVDKPPFLPVAPSGRFVSECLIYRVERKLGLKGVAPIHRLDRMTSGLVLLSKRKEARAAYGRLFETGRLEKIYRALCPMPERPERSEWTIESVIEKGDPWFRMSSRPPEGGERANSKTHAELIDWKEGIGTFRLRPITGKTHQLRLHMAELGYPILRDPLYPKLLDKKPDDFSSPMALLAQSIAFEDPFSGETVRFESRQTLKTPESSREK